MSGVDRRPRATALRFAGAVAEPFYSAATNVRNRLFDSGAVRSFDLGRPTISVGNITAGGTGKTPMVRWLAERLRANGRHIAILARGYKSQGKVQGDEQHMLDAALNTGALPKVELIANPDRVVAAAAALARDPGIDLFILDDAFQHRRARRDLDLVLLSAPEPFGYGRVLPRGLLRESLPGLRRAGACILTHCDQVSEATLAGIEREVRKYHANVPIYRAAHVHLALKGFSATDGEPMERLRTTPFFAFAGIGSPLVLDHQLRQWGSSYCGSRWFADHHSYAAPDLSALQSAAIASGARSLVTTEKDWIKLRDLPGVEQGLPILRIEMAMHFLGDDEARFWKQITDAVFAG